MSRTTATPEPHLVFNELDRHGILLDLPRIHREKNAEYKQRLLDVFVNRASSTYRGLINGLTRELGLSIVDTISIVPIFDGNGDTLLPSPAVEFIDTKCILYNDYIADDVLLEIDRFSVDSASWSLTGLVNTINATGYFTATLSDGIDGTKRSMTIFNQASVIPVISEDISGAGSLVVLAHQNIIEGTVSVRSDSLRQQVATEAELTYDGTYTMRYKEGNLVTLGAPSPGSFIRYMYRDDNFIAQGTPVILHNLQSDDFRSHMFEDVSDDATPVLGAPTALGADIINELLSVHPTSWGT